LRKFVYITFVGFIIFVGLILLFGNIYLEYLWFDNLGYSSVFIAVLFSKWGIRVLLWFIYFSFVLANLLITRKYIREFLYRRDDDRTVVIDLPYKRAFFPGRINLTLVVVSAAAAFLFTSFAGGYWLEVLQFFKGAKFNLTDPIFDKDIGFYVFRLPFLEFLYQYVFLLLSITLLIVAAIYFITNPPRRINGKWDFFPKGQLHVTVLLAMVFVTKAFGYVLQMYNLLYSPRGVTFGASYTDTHAQLPGLRILFIISLGLALLVLTNLFLKRSRLVVYSVIGLIAVSPVLGNIYPSLVQKFIVEPNEFVKEEPYIKYNISMTQYAYGLHQIEVKNFPADDNLTPQDLKESDGTIRNIRLWDYRPLQQTYSQLQEIRPYYELQNIDTDRYTVDGVYRQVMVAARELDQDKLPAKAQTWVNKRLQYTHGYGIVMSPVNEVTPDGLPRFFIKNIPPVSSIELQVTRPEVYYGEMTDEMVITRTRTREFNYPKGQINAYTTYEGDGGVPVGSFLRRVLFALKFGDFKILLSGSLTPESRIMYDRNILRRVNKIAPFLRYDKDPYLVLNDGKLFWIQDAYTVTTRFPYSEPYGEINYIRNSVKVVIDAYNGSVDFYVVDPEEPIAKTLGAIFPRLFKPFEEMPEGLKAHIRYPEDLFKIQSRVYATYHMTDPRVFYNKEDQWEIPREVYANETIEVDPYYTILELPGENKPEFILMQPFSPLKKNVMISWMAARCDGEHYGKLLVYLFPKDKQVYGTSQIEARIDQDPYISQQLSLWNQRGSNVIRGNLLVLPVKDSIIYVEPVYLQAEQSQIPELIRVIVAYRESVVMESTLQDALAAIFEVEPERPEKPAEPDERLSMKELIQRANELFLRAQERQRQGDWAGYGELLDELEEVLNRLSQMAD